MPIENRMALLRNLIEEKPIFDIEPEIIQWAKLHTDIFLERWKKGNQPHWNQEQERNNYIGMIGHKIFEVVLQQFEIPYMPNDPTLDWRQKKNYDFRVPNVGTIEIKTVDFKSNQTRLLVKCAEWHDSGFCLAIKLQDETPTEATFAGYATGKEVEEFNYAENEYPCLYYPCYWELLEKLHSANEFINMLITKTAGLWKRQ